MDLKKNSIKWTKKERLDRDGDGQVVSLLAFYSDDPSSNPAEVYSWPQFLFCKLFEKNVKKLKVARDPTFKKEREILI